jgi:hypothetical protein
MSKRRIRNLLLLGCSLLLLPFLRVRAQTFAAPANLQVTKVAAYQMQICWQSVSGATRYRVIEEVIASRDFMVDSTATGTICTTIALFRDEDVVNSCQGHRIKVAAGTISGDSYVQGPYSSPYTVQLNPIFDDPTLPDPWCDPNNTIAGIWDLQGLVPTALAVTDITAANASTPSIKLTLICPALPAGISKDHYEIYESIRNANGTTTTRTTSSNTCPNNKTLGGSWGQRVTVTVAGVYATGSGQNREVFRGRCSPPASTTYGGIIVPSPTLTVPATANASTITINGSVPTTNAITVLLFVNPTSFNQSAPTQTITSFTTSGGNKNFTAIIPLSPTINTVYAVTTTGSGSTTKYSKPSAISFIKNYPPPLATPTWGTLPTFQIGGGLYLTGTTAPGARVVITPTAPDGTILPVLSTDGCTDGTFGISFPLSGLAPGTYTFSAQSTDAESTGQNTTSAYVNEIYPAPTVTLDMGGGPLYVKTNSVWLNGKVTPANLGTGFTVAATIPTQAVTTTPCCDIGPSAGFFTLPALTLVAGTNNVNVTAVYNANGQAAAPINSTIIFDNQTPTATAMLTTQIPNPTNQATWTLNGTITGFQGTVENAQVVLSGGPAATFPVAADGTWTGNYTFPDGANQITFKVSDRAGNLGPISPTYPVNVVSQGMRAVFNNTGGTCSASEGPWPATLDNVCQQTLSFASENTIPLTGSRLDLFLDEEGRRASASPPSCPRDDLSCLVTRKPTPDVTITFSSATAVRTLPSLRTGLHTIRMVLTDPFGTVTERGGVVLVGPNSGWAVNGKEGMAQPLANFAIPGVITTQTPKLVGRSGEAVESIDCADFTGGPAPTIEYWISQGGGTWNDLPILTSTKANGIYEITPNYAAISGGKIPLTNAGGGQVLRLKISLALSSPPTPPYKLYGRKICNTAGATLSEGLRQWAVFFGGTDGEFIYDLPYRAPLTGDPTAPQIDTSASTTSVTTDDEAPYAIRIFLRVTELDADLDYRSVTVTPPGCADASCVITPRLDGDQKLTSATPGGWYSATVNLAPDANTFVVSASDDAGHTTTSNLVITRTLTPVIAKITRPSATGSFGYPNPRIFTFDASASINRTGSPLRFQWTRPTGINGSVTTWSQITSAPIYSEYLAGEPSGFNKRRVIVSNSTITPAPDPTIDNPCASFSPGQCGTAQIIHNRTCTTTGFPLTPSITAPSTGTSVALNLPVTLSGTAGNDASPYYVYRWDLTNNDTGESFTVPQAAGPSGDGYANSNRVLTVQLGTITGLTPGNYLQTFSVGTNASGENCIQSAASTTRNITVVPKQYQASGLAPGTVLPGSSELRFYGYGLDASARLVLRGPIYALTDTEATTPLCTTSCPEEVLASVLGGNGTILDGTLPANASPGIYQVLASDSSAGVSSSAVWLAVESPQTSAPAKTQEFTNIIRPLRNGQTLSGQFLPGRDPSGQYSDVDYYSFFATAGSRLSLSLTRTDTTLPWEAPDALDPLLEVLDEDGIIRLGFEVLDNSGADLNASINDLVIPRTGRYVVWAATTKGTGAYQLSFSLTPTAPTAGQQVIAAANNDRTVRVGTDGLSPAAFVFDPRGYPMSGALTQFVPTPESNERGQISFPVGDAVFTSVRGFAILAAKLTAAGKISFEARLQDAGVIVPQGALATAEVGSIPTYPVIGAVNVRDEYFDARTGELRMHLGKIDRIETPRPEAPVVMMKKTDKGKQLRPVRVTAEASSNARSASSVSGGLRTLAITTCSPKQFRAAGVDDEDVHGPFTVTLTDLTPKTGESSTEGEVIGVDGINGHRVDKTIRIKIGIKDAFGFEPNYPVLVRLVLAGGDPLGTLILDPDSARIPCQSASFLWHEIDENGQLIRNDEFEYELTKRAAFAGVKPDPEHQGEVLPVWGTTEYLKVFFGTFDEDNNLTNQFSGIYGTHAEPQKPDHLEWNPTGPVDEDRFDYLTMYGAEFSSWPDTNGVSIFNVYYLVDEFGNRIYGQRGTGATSPMSNVQVSFGPQDVSTDQVISPIAYSVSVTWNNNPEWPNGQVQIPLSVTGTDVEGGPFSVSRTFTASFSQPTFYSLEWVKQFEPPYDAQKDTSVSPEVEFLYVSPGAARTRLNGDLARDSIVLVTGTMLSAEPVLFEGGTQTTNDSYIVADALDSFSVSLVDRHGQVATDGVIQVSLCPILDHRPGATYLQVDTRECLEDVEESAGGIIPIVHPNERGYMGLMVIKAPALPGPYYFRIKPLPGNTHTWYVGGFLWPSDNFLDLDAVVVQDGEFLDENYQRINPLLVREPRQVYLRLIDSIETAASQDLTVHAAREDGTELGSGVPITVPRLGASASKTFLAPLVLYRDGDTLPQRAAGTSPLASRSGPSRVVPGGLFTLQVKKGSQVKFPKNGAGPYQFKIEYADPSNSPVAEQYTEIDGNTPEERVARNYAEKTYLLISVIDTHRDNALAADYNGCAFLQERKITTQEPPLVFDGPLSSGSLTNNNAYNGGDLIFSPDVTPALQEGKPGLPFLIEGGKSKHPTTGGAVYVRAVARYRQIGGIAGPPTSDFNAKLQASTPCPTTEAPVDPSDEGDGRLIAMWVDQKDYFPRGQAPQRHADRPAGTKVSIDWIESHARDLFDSQSATAAEQMAFNAVLDVRTDVIETEGPHRTGDAYGLPHIGAFLPTQFRIHINPRSAGLRWGLAFEAPFEVASRDFNAGFRHLPQGGRIAKFEYVLTHESRHALQHRVADDPTAGDADSDFLGEQPIWNSAPVDAGSRIVDSRNTRQGGANTEFDLHPDRQDRQPVVFSVNERDALRFQRYTEELQSYAADILPEPTATIAAGSVQAIKLATVQTEILEPRLNMAGTMVRATVVSGECLLQTPPAPPATSELFSAFDPATQDVQSAATRYVFGTVVAPATAGTCTIRLNMIRPAGLGGLETEGPDHDVVVAIQ